MNVVSTYRMNGETFGRIFKAGIVGGRKMRPLTLVERENRVLIMEQRAAMGRDIWTGDELPIDVNPFIGCERVDLTALPADEIW